METEYCLHGSIPYYFEDIKSLRTSEPVNSSFYIAVGVGLIETMIRFIKCPKYLNPVLASLRKYEKNARCLAERVGWGREFEDFSELLRRTIGSNELSGALDYYNRYSKTEERYNIRVIDCGMRAYFCAMKTEHPEQRKILSQAPYDKDNIYFVDNFVKALKVHLHIYSQVERVIMKQHDRDSRRPLIWIFRDILNRYYTAYHLMHLEFEKDPLAFPTEKLEEFPFSYQEKESNITVSPANLKEDLYKKLLQELARKAIGDGFGRDRELLELISDLLQLDPDLNQNYLKSLYNKLNESIQ